MSRFEFFDIIAQIKKNRNEILEILVETTNMKAALEEIELSISTLENAEAEIARYRPPTVPSIAVFHSSNVQLYSYVLYGIVPCAFVDAISIRPSARVPEQLSRLHKLLGGPFGLPVQIVNVGQRKFVNDTSAATVVIFTGKYENAIEVLKSYPNALFLFFGSGLNPYIVGDGASLDLATESLIHSRLFNSGQDCMSPDVVFVDRKICDAFADHLTKKVRQIRVGPRSSKATLVAPLIYDGVIDEILSYISDGVEVLLRGEINIQKRICEPIVAASNIEDGPRPREFFGPIFNIVSYENILQVEKFLLAPQEKERAFAISTFGRVEFSPEVLDCYLALDQASLFTNENGNEPFGGYGPRASFASFRGRINSRPLLLSREIASAFGSGFAA